MTSKTRSEIETEVREDKTGISGILYGLEETSGVPVGGEKGRVTNSNLPKPWQTLKSEIY